MSYTIEPVDPLVLPERDNTYFFADEKMLDILIHDDIEEYLQYIRNKRYSPSKYSNIYVEILTNVRYKREYFVT